MKRAVVEQDFETAAKLRDELAADGDGYFRRQTLGRMGLGSDHQVLAPPPGWTPPVKPDPLTARRGGRKRPS